LNKLQNKKQGILTGEIKIKIMTENSLKFPSKKIKVPLHFFKKYKNPVYGQGKSKKYQFIWCF